MKKIHLLFPLFFLLSIFMNGCEEKDPTAADTAVALYESFRYGDTEKLLKIGYPLSYIQEAIFAQTESDKSTIQTIFSSLHLTAKSKQLEEIMNALSVLMSKLAYTVDEIPSDDKLVVNIKITTNHLDFIKIGDTAIKTWSNKVKKQNVFHKTQSASILKNALLDSLNTQEPSVQTVEKIFPFTRQNIIVGEDKTYVMWAPKDPEAFATELRAMMTTDCSPKSNDEGTESLPIK